MAVRDRRMGEDHAGDGTPSGDGHRSDGHVPAPVPAPPEGVVPAPAQEVLPAPLPEVLPAPLPEVLPAPVPEALPAPVQEVLPAPVPEVLPAPVPEVLPAPVPEALPAPLEPVGTPYAGLATRTLAFAVDAAIINVVAWFVAGAVALGLSLIGVPHDVRVILAAIGAALALAWSVLYFVFFWSGTGETPGDRVMRIRVQDADSGTPVSLRRALVRVLMLPVAALPLCAGFLLILVTRRRRGLQDLVAHTVVVYVPDARPAARGARSGSAGPLARRSGSD